MFLALSSCRLDNDAVSTLPVVYLGWDEKEQNQIYIFVPDQGSEQITHIDNGVHDYAIAPNGQSIAYSTVDEDGTSRLWVTDLDENREKLLLECLDAQCSFPVWAQDNRRLIYERRPSGEDDILSAPQLWWIDTKTQDTQSVLEDEFTRGTAARFSPDGEWLSYVSPEEESLIFYNLADGRSSSAPSEIGVPAAWSPASKQVLVPYLDVVIIHGDQGDDHLQHTHGYQSATHIFKLNLETDEVENISGDKPVEDSVPAWSPDGELIAFGRRFAGTDAGRQLWLMTADGSEQRPLADEPAVTYGPPKWSPDGRYLLVQRFETDDSNNYPSIWLFDLETGQSKELVTQAMQPSWLVDRTEE
jgi:Tol biopolymer transport system component